MLHERTKSNGNFLNIKHGALCLESKEPVDGYEEVTVDDISRQNPDGSHPQVTKYIKKYGGLDGKITRIEWYDRTDGGVHYLGAKLHIRDGGQHYQVDLPFGKKHFDYFTKVMDNIDFSQPVELNAWRDKKDPRQTAFVVKQNGDYVQWNYTRDNMGDCPPAVQNRSGKWSFENQREWLLARLQDVIIPQVNALNEFDEPMPDYGDEAIADDIGFGRIGDEPEFGPLHIEEPPEDLAIVNEEVVAYSDFPKPAKGGFDKPIDQAGNGQIKALAALLQEHGKTISDIVEQEFTDISLSSELSKQAATYLLATYGG